VSHDDETPSFWDPRRAVTSNGGNFTAAVAKEAPKYSANLVLSAGLRAFLPPAAYSTLKLVRIASIVRMSNSISNFAVNFLEMAATSHTVHITIVSFIFKHLAYRTWRRVALRTYIARVLVQVSNMIPVDY
jgi:hypothetical protein